MTTGGAAVSTAQLADVAHSDRFDLDRLIESWRGAFQAAQAALREGILDHDFSASEVHDRTVRLRDERAAVVELIGSIARDHHARPLLARLLATPLEARRLLGIPLDVSACVFNVDGVLVASAAIHAEAWKETFDEFLSARAELAHGLFLPNPFSRHHDYPTLIHGKSSTDAVRGFLASRGISLPEGVRDDPPGAPTVHGLANRKQKLLVERLEHHGVSAYYGARLYLALARDAGLRCAVVSGSTHARTLVGHAGLAAFVEVVIDGNVAARENLARKPAPDMLLAACSALGVEPDKAVVFETTRAGAQAGRVGGFREVVAIDQEGDARMLAEQGADLVVGDLGEILERALAH